MQLFDRIFFQPRAFSLTKTVDRFRNCTVLCKLCGPLAVCVVASQTVAVAATCTPDAPNGVLISGKTETCGPGAINQSISYRVSDTNTVNVVSGTAVNAPANETGIAINGVAPFTAAVPDVTVNIAADAQINAPGGFGVRILDPAVVTLTNGGQITAMGDGIGIVAGSAITVKNTGSVFVNGPVGPQNGHGINAFAENSVSVVNSGQITALNSTPTPPVSASRRLLLEAARR
jgi:hypothetical protein